VKYTACDGANTSHIGMPSHWSTVRIPK